jgi:hypothetical protein
MVAEQWGQTFEALDNSEVSAISAPGNYSGDDRKRSIDSNSLAKLFTRDKIGC